MTTPLKFRLNPCDIDRHPALAPVGDALTALYQRLIESTGCPCCRAVRVAALVVLAFAAGYLGAL